MTTFILHKINKMFCIVAVWVKIPDGFWILNTRSVSKRNTKFLLFTLTQKIFYIIRSEYTINIYIFIKIREIISSAAAEAYVPLRPAVSPHVTARHEVTVESESLAGADRDSECERVRLKVLRYMIAAWLLQMRVFSSPLARRFVPRRISFKTSADAANRTENYGEKINGSTMNSTFHSSSKDPKRQNSHTSRNSSLKHTLEALNQDSCKSSSSLPH